jgi:hypothetical protein
MRIEARRQWMRWTLLDPPVWIGLLNSLMMVIAVRLLPPSSIDFGAMPQSFHSIGDDDCSDAMRGRHARAMFGRRSRAMDELAAMNDTMAPHTAFEFSFSGIVFLQDGKGRIPDSPRLTVPAP